MAKREITQIDRVQVLPPSRPETILGAMTLTAQLLEVVRSNPHAWNDVKIGDFPELKKLVNRMDSDIQLIKRRFA